MHGGRLFTLTGERQKAGSVIELRWWGCQFDTLRR
jgi:hypothetical protein